MTGEVVGWGSFGRAGRVLFFTALGVMVVSGGWSLVELFGAAAIARDWRYLAGVAVMHTVLGLVVAWAIGATRRSSWLAVGVVLVGVVPGFAAVGLLTVPGRVAATCAAVGLLAILTARVGESRAQRGLA